MSVYLFVDPIAKTVNTFKFLCALDKKRNCPLILSHIKSFYCLVHSSYANNNDRNEAPNNSVPHSDQSGLTLDQWFYQSQFKAELDNIWRMHKTCMAVNGFNIGGITVKPLKTEPLKTGIL